jgi:hypothetical protein
MKSCIHYSEKALIQIQSLEHILSRLKHSFVDEVVLIDTNKKQIQELPNWQYPALENWVIRKEELDTL